MSDDNTEAKAAAAPAAKASLFTKLTPVLLLANLGAAGAGVYFQMKPHPIIVMPAPAAAAEAPSHGGGESGPGPTAPLDSFVVNLNEPGQSRYLKATFELELSDSHAADALERDKKSIRDEVLRYLSNLTVADTLGAENKDKIRAEIVARIDKQLGQGKVKKVFFNDFVVQ
jgi:flagellar protein FliL